MDAAGTTEDRVFGRPELYPPLPPALYPDTETDVFSVSVEGAEVRYACRGAPSRPPLVFVHGWGASFKFWKKTLPYFSPRFRCLAPDLPGFGTSEKPDRDYSMEALAAWLGRFLDAAGARRASIVGHSMGGTIALLLALEAPERVERLAVVNPVVTGSTAFSGAYRFLMMPGIRAAAWLLARWKRFRRWVAKDFSYVQRLDDELADDVARPTYRAAVETLRALAAVDLAPRLGRLSMPVLSVGTDLDRVVEPGQFRQVPGRTALLSGCGHMPMLERPDEFNRLLDAFLRGEGGPDQSF
jgi:pyruvate dehydrogenase E2 component (dihydrolipoamide acetyltransferase)